MRWLTLLLLALSPATAGPFGSGPFGAGVTPAAERYVVLPADVTNDTTTDALATGMTFTPEPSGVYAVRVECAYTSAAVTTGISWGIRDHATAADGSGALRLFARGASAAATVTTIGTLATGASLDVNGTSTGSGETPFYGLAIWTADATPQPVGVYFSSEVGASAVTLKGGKCFLAVRRLS